MSTFVGYDARNIWSRRVVNIWRLKHLENVSIGNMEMTANENAARIADKSKPSLLHNLIVHENIGVVFQKLLRKGNQLLLNTLV